MSTQMLLSAVMSLLQVLLCALLQFYGKKLLKTVEKSVGETVAKSVGETAKKSVDISVNKKLFWKVMPVLLKWLKPVSTPVMLELKHFQGTFGACSEDQQLLIISQMAMLDEFLAYELDEIRYVHSCVEKSDFLRGWQEEVRTMNTFWAAQNRYDFISDRLSIALNRLGSDHMGRMMIQLVRISHPSVMREMQGIYWSLKDGTETEYIDDLMRLSTQSCLYPEERERRTAVLSQSSPSIQHVLFLHHQMEQQMLLYLQQLKQQLNMRIKMELELEQCPKEVPYEPWEAFPSMEDW